MTKQNLPFTIAEEAKISRHQTHCRQQNWVTRKPTIWEKAGAAATSIPGIAVISILLAAAVYFI